MKAWLKRKLSATVIGTELLALLQEVYQQRFFRNIGLKDLNHRIWTLVDGRVAQGPFRDMKCVKSSCGSVLAPKLFGSYEEELHPFIKDVVGLDPDLIVDLGSAEGYYAVGFALRCPNARVVAFDSNPVARWRMNRQTTLNGVRARVRSQGVASTAALNSVLAPATRPVVWCDIEGGEHTVLDPVRCPALTRAVILFETHEHVTGRPWSEVAARFGATHTACHVPSQPRQGDVAKEQLDALGLGMPERALAVSEFRPANQGWVVMHPFARDGEPTTASAVEFRRI